MEATLQSRLQTRLDQNPDDRAIAFYTAQGDYSWYSFGKFYQHAACYAAQLSNFGLKKGEVCILVLQSEEFSATLVLSALILGAVPLLIAPPVMQGEGAYSNLIQVLKRMIHKTKPAVVICDESMTIMRDELIKTRRKTRYLFGEASLSLQDDPVSSIVFPRSSDVAAYQLTSGTTGFPRICVWRQQNVLAALDGMVTAMGLTSEDICLNWTPLYHDMGLVNNFLTCMAYNVPVVMLNPKDFVKSPAIWLRSLHQTGATTTWSPNFGYAITEQRVRPHEIEGVDLSGVKAFWNAAERIHYETIQAFYKKFRSNGLRYESLKTNFGCTENIGGATFTVPNSLIPVEKLNYTLLQERRLAVPVTPNQENVPTLTVVGCGHPHPTLKINIVNRLGKPLPNGHVGEIALDSPSRLEKFLGDAIATRRTIQHGLVRTGDLGYMRNGELFWVGRVRERINIRGKKLDPSDFEPVLMQIPDLRQGCFAAFGIDESSLGTQEIILVTEVRDSTERDPLTIAGDIRTLALNQMGININNVVLVRSGTLTKTSSGKRRHRFFKQLYLKNGLEEFEWHSAKNGK